MNFGCSNFIRRRFLHSFSLSLSFFLQSQLPPFRQLNWPLIDLFVLYVVSANAHSAGVYPFSRTLDCTTVPVTNPSCSSAFSSGLLSLPSRASYLRAELVYTPDVRHLRKHRKTRYEPRFSSITPSFVFFYLPRDARPRILTGLCLRLPRLLCRKNPSTMMI